MKKVILFLTVVFALWAAGCGRDAAVSYELEPTAERTPDTEGKRPERAGNRQKSRGRKTSLCLFLYMYAAPFRNPASMSFRREAGSMRRWRRPEGLQRRPMRKA